MEVPGGALRLYRVNEKVPRDSLSRAGLKVGYYWRRFKNRRLNAKEFAEGRAVLRSYPHIAVIDVTNACPLSCPLCPTGTNEGGAPKGMMRLETFKSVYDRLAPYLYELHLYNWGEPFLNRDLADMVRYAKRFYNPQVILSTTLMKVTPEWAQEVVRSGVDLISVSIDGATQEVYEKYRVGGDLEHVFSVLKYMVEVKRTHGLKRPVLRWQFIPMSHNEGEVDAARQMAREMGVEFRTHRVRLNVKSFDTKDFEELAEENKGWLPSDPKYIRYGEDWSGKNACKYLWSSVAVNWDGSVVPCCKIFSREDAFTDSVGDDFMKVWNGPSYVKAREIFGGRPAEKGFVCQRCYDHNGNI